MFNICLCHFSFVRHFFPIYFLSSSFRFCSTGIVEQVKRNMFCLVFTFKSKKTNTHTRQCFTFWAFLAPPKIMKYVEDSFDGHHCCCDRSYICCGCFCRNNVTEKYFFIVIICVHKSSSSLNNSETFVCKLFNVLSHVAWHRLLLCTLMTWLRQRWWIVRKISTVYQVWHKQ